MSFRAYCVSIGFTCCHCLSVKSTYAEANALLIDCLVIFCLSLNHCSHPLKHLKSIPIFHGYIISLHFQLLAIHCGILLSNMAKQSNSLFCALLCFARESSWVFKHHPLPKPLVQYNPGFLNTLTGWSVGFYMPGFFSFIFVHFFNVLLVFPLLSCPCFCFVSWIQATTKEIGEDSHLLLILL